MTTEALVPAAAEPAVATGGGAEIVLPQVIVDAGPQATARFLEFFAGRIANAEESARITIVGKITPPTEIPPIWEAQGRAQAR